MRVLVIGSGAREHALLWKLAQSRRVRQLWAAPGNPGMATLAECVPIGLNELERLADFAERQAIELTVVGPEAPLIAGLVDVFRARGLPIFGPTQAGAMLEGSKAFAKELMETAGIPTAQHRTFRDPAAALAYLEEHGAPVVVKADGNAAGKGAIVALDLETARTAVRQMMVERIFGSAGEAVVIEDYLQGDEIGSTAICNGTSFVPLVLTQDHKRALDNDEGLNTGGMGAYAPLPFVSAETERIVHEHIIASTLRALEERGITFSGVLYSNIMLTEHGPMVLEHNTRFGDPETQAMMLLLKADLLDLLQAPERLASDSLWHPGYAVSLTLASGGYPGSYRTGLPIQGLAEAGRLEQVQVFHAGTALRDGELVTAGGRVLSVAAYGTTLAEALERAYEAAHLIRFEGMHYRRDIAKRGLRALQS
ncbi:MAG: phosphoribosylamine--glycine ligase [Thermogemmatispora sp.]|uniref:phosphoribosylamine--glycine ligase n=1 Tax=Thermogemmatispora sp. TaxID=1968838 RepID=UPI0026102ED8|nr:phosphoribosylamine--glycine ligase [Thermogemmatispora sp.]MBX5455384.1 phosphoribosylamine--glycine ligase [Thermogemmatispora sp.]